MKKPTKAIIAAAGFGTRFLPQTKAMPKEMMPLIDKPIIQYVVEELVDAGIRDIIIVGSSNKRAIEDHFDTPNEDLLSNLRAGGQKKQHLIEELEQLSNLANFVYVRQKGPYGNATPLMSAAHLINKDESFIYTWADDFIVASPSRFQQMIDIQQQYDGAVLSCKKITSDSEYDRYGVAAGEAVEDGLIKVSHIVEKPGKANAPSDLASVSSYLLTCDFFGYLEKAQAEFDGVGEFTFQPIMQKMIDEGHTFCI
jgi:UTP--glucose-1-phosphate uridylyltransferase